MPLKKPIPTAERRYQDYLRRKTLKVGNVYETRLIKARRGELRRVLALARDLSDPDALPGLIEGSLSEASYLPEWWTGLWTTAGVPQAQSVARILRQEKAAGEKDVWLATLRRYAILRAGNEIVSVTGTWKSSLVGLLRTYMATQIGASVEKLTKMLYNGYVGQLEKWQCRRIAQTESMIGAAEAGALAADTLDVEFTKQWCISGLGNTRASHELMDGVIVDENEPFELPGGNLMYPHDPSMGADAGEIINCACACIRRPKGMAQQTVTEQPAANEAQADPTEERIQEIMSGMNDNISEDDRRKIAENTLEIEKNLGVKQGDPMSFEKADEGKENPKFSLGGKYRTNCQTCTVTHELRRRGFDVEAKSFEAYEKLEKSKKFNDWRDRFLNPDGSSPTYQRSSDYARAHGYKTMTQKRVEEFIDAKTKEKGRYEVYVQWKGASSAHVFLAERTDSGLKLFDPQSGKKDVSSYLPMAMGKNIHILRTDNKLINPKITSLFTQSGK